MPANLSFLAAANDLVRRLRCGGIIAHAERVNSSSGGVRCGLSSNYFVHLSFILCLQCFDWALAGYQEEHLACKKFIDIS